MSTRTQLVTAEELLRMPEDGHRYELVNGELRKIPPTGHVHGRFAATLTGSLVRHVTANRLGAVYAAETGFILRRNPDTVRAPDVAFICQERVEEVGDAAGYWPGAPDLAVEVISPSDTYTEVEEKVFEWLDAGTLMLLVVNPRMPSVTVYRSLTDISVLTQNDTLHGGDVVPGWTMPVKDIFL
jgi:Uma2 family endonuclease